MQEHWDEARSFLKREWPQLTEVDLDEIDGEFDRLISRVKSIYGGAGEIIQEAAIKVRLQQLFNQLDQSSNNES